MTRTLTVVVALLAFPVSALALQTNPSGGALTGERYRVIVSTDIGGSDPDDQQSMAHYLVYSDVFDTEGLISSPPGAGRKSHIDEALDAYATDYANLSTYSSSYPTVSYLRSVTKQGATGPQSGTTPPSTISSGAQHIIDRAKAGDSRPLYVLVWGSITDVAQAVHKDPSIKSKIRIHSIGSWNTDQDPKARDYLINSHGSSLWMIESDVTFRGMYQGGNQSGDLGNSTFVSQHVNGHGALGNYFYSKKTSIKMGDTPSVLYLMRGNPGSPTGEHWGGQFWKKTSVGNTFWTDISDQSAYTDDQAKATVNKWREKYLRDWQARMDRCLKPSSGGGGGATAPTAPTSLAANAVSTSQINLTWNDNSNNEDDFQLQRSPDNSSWSTIDTPSSGATSASDTGLSAGTTYYYQVRARNSAGNSPWSNVASATTQTSGGGGGGSGITITNTQPSTYTWSTLGIGGVQYTDRTYTFSSVASAYDGLDLLQTANDDKGSSGSVFITFDVDQDVTVCVAHDDRFTTQPGWMAGFADTGEDLVAAGTTFSLYCMDFTAGTVTLGGNNDAGQATNSMYSVVVAPAGTPGVGGGSGGSGGGTGGGGSGGGSGGTGGTSSSSSKGGSCGATGLEVLFVIGLLGLRRNRRR